MGSRRLLHPPDVLLPPPRPGTRHVRIVLAGIIVADDGLRARVDRAFHWPMIVLALLILPLLAIDHFSFSQMPAEVRNAHWLYWCIRVGFTIIWLAFLVEFIVKIAVAECRVEYVKRNWLDLVIILVPVLRPIRAAYLTKTTRVFTLRGVGMKCARYVFTMVIGLEATERLLQRVGLKARRDQRDPSTMTRHELTREVRRLRKLTHAWEAWHRANVEHHEGAELPAPPAADPDEMEEPARSEAVEPPRRAAPRPGV